MAFVKTWYGEPALADDLVVPGATHLFCLNPKDGPGCGRRNNGHGGNRWNGRMWKIQGTFAATTEWTVVPNNLTGTAAVFDWYFVRATTRAELDTACDVLFRDAPGVLRHSRVWPPV